MRAPVLVDAGPLVAYINRLDPHHQWTEVQFRRCRPPLLTCEAVFTEVCFLLAHIPGGTGAAMGLLPAKMINPDFRLIDEHAAVAVLMARYSNVPMSLADACLVRMAEVHAGSVVLTLDSDFRIYRKNRRERIPLLIPEDQ